MERERVGIWTLAPTIFSANSSAENSSTGPVWTTWPRRMMVSSSHTDFISASLWLMKMMPVPSRIAG